MKITTRKPALQVILKKNVSRYTLDGSTNVASRFANATQDVDLTPYMGEHDSVKVIKSVREPAGAFSLTLTDQLYYPGTTLTAQGKAAYGDSLYGLIEPMDSIEIRMSGDAYKSQTPPMMMRGLVSRVGFTETMGADGKPQRTIIVSGQDYGKILQQMQIFYMPGLPTSDASYMTAFPFFSQFGESDNIQPAADFIEKLFKDVVNPYIANIRNIDTVSAFANPLKPIQPDITVSGGKVAPYGLGDWLGGTIYSLIMSMADVGPWNEFFIEDREDGPYAVYRPNPFYAVDNTPIFSFPSGKFPVTNVIYKSDVVSISPSRTDANVANYFWVDSPRYNLNFESTLRMVAVQENSETGNSMNGPYVSGYANVDPTLYGERKMWEQTNQAADAEQNNGNGTPQSIAREEAKTAAGGWIKQRRIDLIAQNKDNVVFETGTMRLKGNEAIRAGTYIQYQPGNVPAFYYVVSVEHDFTPFGSYFTTVQFERGTGFIGRVQQDAGATSPYLAEMVDKDG